MTLEVLGQRLAGREPADLAAQLPTELKELLDQHIGAAETSVGGAVLATSAAPDRGNPASCDGIDAIDAINPAPLCELN